MKTHIENERLSMEENAADLVRLTADLDHRHRQQRKIQFLLDVRGYFVNNQIKGAYVEFGLYRGEMMFAAHHVLDGTGCFTQYVGLDSFAGEPEFSPEEQEANPALKIGDYRADYDTTRGFLEKHIGPRLVLIRGGFRQPGRCLPRR